MADNTDSSSTWNDYRRRRRWFIAAWLGGPVICIPLSIALTKWIHSDIPFYFLGGPMILGFLVAGLRLTFFRCPHCHRWFSCTWWYSNLFARRCVHCGIKKWTAT